MTDLSNPEEITRNSNSNFRYSFLFLPREKRQAIYALYAFCRQTDDIADTPAPIEKKIDLLNRWEQELTRCFGKRVSNYFSSIFAIADRFKIPFELFLDLIAGVRMDLQNFRYNSFEDLKLYCYRVASTVGLMSIEIFGYKDPVIKKYAESLGIALQLTNIIRDVGADAKMGRIYLPREDLERFNVSEADIYSFNYSAGFKKLLAFEAERAYSFYRLAEENLPPTERRNMVVGEIIKNIYLSILRKIERQHFNVLQNRIRISNPTKFFLALRTVSQIKFSA